MLKIYKKNINFFILFYLFYFLVFCFINFKYTSYGKLFFLYISFFFILIPASLFIKNYIFKSFINALFIIFIIQPPYVFFDNLIKKNTINTFEKNINFSYTLEKGKLEGINGIQNITTDNNGFRSLKDSNYNLENTKNKIFFIGGSTTANIVLDDKFIFSNVVETLSANQLISINAGKTGHTSRQNLITFKYIVENFNPDYVVFLIGVNDWAKSINHHFSPFRENELIKSFFLQLQPLTKIYAKVYEKIKNKKTYVNATMFKKLQGKYNFKPKKEYYPKNVSNEFSKNIKSISNICTSHKKIKCIFMTQPAIYDLELNDNDIEKLWFTPPFYDWALNMESLIHIKNLYNNFIKNNCIINEIHCFDLSAKIDKKTEYFYDDIHFNKHGNIFIGQLLNDFLRKEF